MTTRRLPKPPSLESIVESVDQQRPGEITGDTVPSGFPSLDTLLGGGLRRRDLVLLGGDIGSGKSALALGIALRVARQGLGVAFLSGEMDEGRLMERALAIEGRASVDELRTATLNERARAGVGAAVVRLRGLPLAILPLAAPDFESMGERLDAVRQLALERQVALLVVAQLPRLEPTRENPRPTLDDFGHLGATKQHADVVLAIFREDMYHPGGGVDGATELIVAKNRNGPTGFVDFYFYRRWMRFEDVLDPDR